MAGVRDLSTSNAVFKQICYKQQANRFLQVKYLPEKQKDCIWSMKIPLQSFPPFLKEFNLSTLPRVMSLMNGEAGAVFTIKVACLALEDIMKDQVEQLNAIGVTATAMVID